MTRGKTDSYHKVKMKTSFSLRSLDSTESLFVQPRVISSIESLSTAGDPLNHTKRHEESPPVEFNRETLQLAARFLRAPAAQGEQRNSDGIRDYHNNDDLCGEHPGAIDMRNRNHRIETRDHGHDETGS